MFRPDAPDDLPTLCELQTFRQGKVAASRLNVSANNLASNKIHLRGTYEPGHKEIPRRVVQLERRANLFDPPVLNDDDLVGHRHGLVLIVSDIDRRRIQAPVQVTNFRSHLHPKLCIEVRQRFVE